LDYKLITLSAILLSACAAPIAQHKGDAQSTLVNACIGTTQLPPDLQDSFELITDKALLDSTLGAPEQGKLCQGKVYQAKNSVDITLFRAWNSTNANSRLGKWWTFTQAAGNVARYRTDYEICYQWSPLDKLTQCKLKAGAKIVLGTGQSAQCSDYLTYPVSQTQQVYIDDGAALENCSDSDALFLWQPSPEQ
jgi:hypothetical protein